MGTPIYSMVTGIDTDLLKKEDQESEVNRPDFLQEMDPQDDALADEFINIISGGK
jgi:hypothetical protein